MELLLTFWSNISSHGLRLDKGIFRKYCETKFQEFLKLSVPEVIVVAVEAVVVSGVELFVTLSSILSTGDHCIFVWN